MKTIIISRYEENEDGERIAITENLIIGCGAE